jgi:hypothetical protein
MPAESAWPALPYGDIRATMETLQLWTQVVGKVRLARTPWVNHSWHVTFYVSVRGLTTSLVSYDDKAIELEFDLVAHVLVIRVSDGGERRVTLEPKSVADFYEEVLAALQALGVPIEIDVVPNEIPEPTPFPKDTVVRAYDRDVAHSYFRALIQVDRVFKRFRTRFIGKCSPVHMFWGSFDLAVTRFSGRRAPLHPGGVPHLSDAVVREAYSHEVSSAGFWPGGGGIDEACFYSYAYPAPTGFADAGVRPNGARFGAELGEFLLPYDVVRTAADPDEALLAFLQSTYDAAADLGGWDRVALDIDEGQIGRPRLIS